MESSALYSQVKAEMECNHPRQELRIYHKSNGTGECRVQCLTCGAMVRSVKKATIPIQQLNRLPKWDDTLSTEHYKKYHERCQELAEHQRNVKNQEWWDWYNAYLRNSRWQEKRQAVFKRCNYVCEGCRQERATDVHHVSYEHVGNELLFELVGLCHECHLRVDNKQAEGKQS
jgi:hypothetical protein